MEKSFTAKTGDDDRDCGWLGKELLKIEKLPAEQVFDIEVEATHNFVAGHYVDRRTNQALSIEQETLYSAIKNLELGTENLEGYNGANAKLYRPSPKLSSAGRLYSKLRKIRDLAGRYGIDAGDLFDYRKLSQVRAIWDNQPVETSNTVNTVEYSRGAGTGKQTGVRPISIDSARVDQRSADFATDFGGVRVDYRTRSSEIEKQIARLIQENKITAKDLELAAKKLRQSSKR